MRKILIFFLGFFLASLSEAQVLQWQKQYQLDPVNGSGVISFVEVENKYFVLCALDGYIITKMLMVKGTGDSLWSKQITIPAFPYIIAQDKTPIKYINNKLYMGLTWVKSTPEDTSLLNPACYDTSGNLIWQKRIPVQNRDGFVARDLRVLGKNGLLFTGHAYNSLITLGQGGG